MIWLWAAISIVLFFVGFFSGRHFRQTNRKQEAVQPPHIGTFIISTADGEVYTVFDTDPKTLKQGDFVAVDILFADVKKSQQNQGA